RYSKPGRIARRLGTETATLLERQFEHRVGHSLVAIVSLSAQGREDDRVIWRLVRAGKALWHRTLSFGPLVGASQPRNARGWRESQICYIFCHDSLNCAVRLQWRPAPGRHRTGVRFWSGQHLGLVRGL